MADRRSPRPPAFPAAAFILILASSCGIDTLSYLGGAPRFVSESPGTVDFKAAAVPDPDCYGLDVFYRIYAGSDDAETDKTAIAERVQARSIPGDYVKSWLLSTGGLKYRKLSLDAGGETSPMLDSPADPEDLLVLSVLAGGSVEFKAGAAAAVPVYRNPGSVFPSFSVRPADTDADYKPDTDDLLPDEYWVQFYAASYGIDATSWAELYSDVVYLGRIAINY